MANFERKQNPFLHRGMNWNAPAEKIPDGQIAWGKNVRVLEQGTVSSAHGNTLVYGPLYGTVFGPPEAGSSPAPIGWYAQFLHSLQRLNILNTSTDVSGTAGIPEFDQFLRRTYVLGADEYLFVFQDQTTLMNTAINPVLTPAALGNIGTIPPPGYPNTDPPFSGNPLSIVDAMPAAGLVSWKYIGDSKTMCTVGYYPGDAVNQTMARSLTMGMTPPVNTSVPTVTLGGNLQQVNGQGYQWIFVYRRVQTGARSNPSAATRASIAQPQTMPSGANAGALFQAQIQVPQTPLDPQTGQPDKNVMVDIYRFGGAILRWALVGSAAGGTVFTDNTPDLNLLAAPTPSQVTDASTGLTRFNLYRPFVIQDIARGGSDATVSQVRPGGPFHVNVRENLFKVDWLPGSTINLDAFAGTIYQVIDQHTIELAEDLTGTGALGGPHDWATPAGTLLAGQPMPHLWGVYGVGQGGSYLFACGDPNNPSTLYWTNGNDPDSTDIVNNIVVTSPSEKLQTGCIYQGQGYCWTTERMFQIYPSLTVFGQFTTQEMAGAKGVWLEWSLSVQNNGFADLSVTWRGKDGIYDMSAGGGLQRLTDPLYPFFPHDGGVGIAPETIMPFIGANSHNPESVGNIDDTQPQYHRTCWHQGLLYYDFVAKTPGPGGVGSKNTFSTLVWDSVNIPGGGWVSLDQTFSDNGHPVVRAVESGATDLKARDDLQPDDSVGGPFARGGNMKVTWGPIIYDYTGYQRGFTSRVITKAEDLGDSRAPKLWGDFWLDCTPLDKFEVTPLVSFHKVPMQTIEVPPAGGPPSGIRSEFILDFPEFFNAGGKGLISPTLGLDIAWQTSPGQFAATLYQWQPSYIIKPEFIELRASDRNDVGAVQAKYLMAANIEANTMDPITGEVQTIAVNVIVDGVNIATLSLSHEYQSEKPYAWEPVAGYEFQVQMQFDPNVNWQLFQINWIFDPWPDAVARKYPFESLGTTADKFIQGIVLPMETGGENAIVGVWGDDDNITRTWSKTTLPLKKTGVVLDLSAPFTAHFIQFQTLTPHRIWPGEARVIWEPIPEATNTWQTQQTDNDMAGWSHLRDCFIAYMGGTGSNLATPLAVTTPVLTITTEYGSMSYDLDPVSPNQYVRCYRVLAPQKAKWHQYRIDAPGPGVRLYQKDTVIRIKEWGSNSAYTNAQPFGDDSRASGARM